jgi:hypothetical protein
MFEAISRIRARGRAVAEPVRVPARPPPPSARRRKRPRARSPSATRWSSWTSAPTLPTPRSCSPCPWS